MDGSKAASLGWRPRVAFEQGLPDTVAWYREHADWVAAARSGDWDAYYERQYGDRLAAGQAVERGRLTVRVAVTGAQGRLGRALIEALEEAPFTGPKGPIAWSRPELDLDTLTADTRDRPDRARPARGRDPRRRLDRRRRLREGPGARDAPERRRRRA